VRTTKIQKTVDGRFFLVSGCDDERFLGNISAMVVADDTKEIWQIIHDDTVSMGTMLVVNENEAS
jgi:hypothetical protein